MKRSSLSTVIFVWRDSGKLKDSGKEAATGVMSPADSQLSGSDRLIRHMSEQSVCQTCGTYGPYNNCDKMKAVPLNDFLKTEVVMLRYVSHYIITTGNYCVA